MSDVKTRAHIDASERKITFNSMQDVEPILERNKALQGEPQKSDFARHVARIPNIFINQWLYEEWARGNTTIKMFNAEFNKLVDRKLRDPDWRWLRTDK